MNRKTILTIIKLIPVVSAVLAYILVFSPLEAGGLTSIAVLLAVFGFAFFFVGRKAAKEDRTLKILGWLDLLSTLAIILMYVIAMVAFAGGLSSGGNDDEDSYHYAVEDQAIGSNIGSFESVDTNGNEVSEAIFADKDVTVVNVWATFCGPCIEEMPELAAWSDEMPDNVGIMGIVIDAPPAGAEGSAVEDWGGDPDNIELAKKICNETGVKYTNILASESVMKTFENVEAVPTTFIVDKDGNLICSPFVGADVDGYKKAVEEYLAGL